MVLETMDYSTLGIINDGPRILMYQLMNENVKDGDLIEEHISEFNDEDKCLVALDVKALDAMGNALLYNIYHFVQNC